MRVLVVIYPGKAVGRLFQTNPTHNKIPYL